MEYHFDAIATRTHLHVIGSGTHCADNIRRLLLDMNQVVIEKQIDAVLIEARFIGPSLGFGGIYSIIADNLADALLVKRIAYVDGNAERLPERVPERIQFAELAANKLGLNARLFRTVAEAERWLNT
jgi:hypothetical protein